MQINNVLITGVSGFIGSNLLDYLLEHTSWNITGIDNLSTGRKSNIEHNLSNKRFAFEQKECSQLESLKAFDCIFHLAALPRIQPSFELIAEHIHANLLQSIHLVELMIKEEHYPKLVYSGSSAIYGTPEQVPTPESSPISCLSPYAFQKYEVEKYLELIATRFPINYVTLRYFNPYGPRSFNPDNPFNAYSSVIGIFLNKFEQGLPLLVTGDGEQQRDFIHVADLASANYKAAIHPDRLNDAFNIGFGDTISIIELARKIAGNNFQFIPKRKGEADITFANIDHAKNILDWQPTQLLDDYLTSVLSIN